MTELRKRMIECLQLRVFSERTQEAYLQAVRQLSDHYKKSPDLGVAIELCAPATNKVHNGITKGTL